MSGFRWTVIRFGIAMVSRKTLVRFHFGSSLCSYILVCFCFRLFVCLFGVFWVVVFLPFVYKSALVKPLLKKMSLDPSDLKNYRPVSNLSFLSKVLERIVLWQLNERLKHSNLLSPLQSAYRPNHSTETVLLRIVIEQLWTTARYAF